MASKLEKCLMGAGFSEKEVKDLFTENPDLEYDKIRAMDFLNERERNLLRAKRNVQLQSLAIDKAEKQVDSFLKRFPGKEKEALNALMTKSGYDFEISTTEGRYHAIKDQAHANLSHYMARHKSNWAWQAADKDFGVKILREMSGKDTGDTMARAAAKDFSEIFEELRLRYNRAGGDIGKISDWNAVQTHDALAMLNSGKGAQDMAPWIEEIKKHLDFDRMNLKKADEIEAFLNEAYTEITSGGLSRPDPGSIPMDARSALANRVGNRHRIFHFKDIDGYLEYQEKFGSQDPFASFMAHIDSMSKDIAVMETLGPNPRTTFKYLKDKLRKSTLNENVADSAEKVFEDVIGETMAQNKKLADRMGSLRAGMAAGKLKFAMLSALSDTAFMGLESHFAGVPVMRTYMRFIKQVAADGDKHLAARVAGVAEFALDTLAQTQRYVDVAPGSGLLNKAAAFTIRGSGLEAWTNAAKRSFALELSAQLGENLTKSLDDVGGNLRKTLGIYGFTDADWMKLRRYTYKHKGSTYVDLSQIVDEDLAVKYSTMMRGELRYAVPEPGWREQAFMKQGTRSGTVAGELIRSGMQFKSYPITMMMLWWSRILRSQALEGKLTRGAYIGALMASTSILGTVSISAKDVAKGKTPPDFNDAKTYVRGFMQGGAAGPVMDYLSESASGRGLEFFFGPLGGEFNKAVTTVSSNATRFAEGKETHLSHSALNQLRGLTPGMWQLSLATRRLLADQLNRVVDPGQFAENARRARSKARKEGQEYYWRQGEFIPEIMQ